MADIIIGNITVQYDRTKKQYQALENENIVEVFPAGPAGRALAIEESIRLENPILHKNIRRVIALQPALTKRIWKAGLLVLNNQVEMLNKEGLLSSLIADEVARVSSLEEPDVAYSILEKDYYTCGCEDFLYGQAPQLKSGQKYCKHVLAFVLKKKLKKTEVTHER